MKRRLHVVAHCSSHTPFLKKSSHINQQNLFGGEYQFDEFSCSILNNNIDRDDNSKILCLTINIVFENCYISNIS